MRITAYSDKYRSAYGAAFYAAAYPDFEVPADAFEPPPVPASSDAAMRTASPAATVQRVSDTQRFARAIPVSGTVDNVESVPALDAPPSERIFLSITNTDTGALGNTLFIEYDQPATAASFPLAAGETRTFATYVPQNAIWLFGSAAGTTFRIEFSNKKAD